MAKSTRAEKKAATRARLLAAAQLVFTEQGFEQASIAAVCKRAGITHGALYHHFASKTILFSAVVEQLFEQLTEGVSKAVVAHQGWEQVVAATSAYLDVCADPAMQSIVFRDGPRVLRDTFDETDAAASEPLVLALLERWVSEGLLRPLALPIVARTTGALFAEAGALIVEADNPAHVREQVQNLLINWLESLRRPSPAGLVLITERLTLTPWCEADRDLLLQIAHEPAIRQFLFNDVCVPAAWIEEATQASQERFERADLGIWVARRSATDGVGFVGFLGDGDDREFVFAVRTDEMRKGYCIEMASAVLREARARGIQRFKASTDEGNLASMRALEKLLFIRIGQRTEKMVVLIDYLRPEPLPS